MAAAVVPPFYSSDTSTVDAAAEEFAAAMRFARGEAMRTGDPRGFRQNSSNKRIRVFRLDTGTVPWTKIYDVYHPVSKKLYDIRLDRHSFAGADNVTHNRVFRGVCNTQLEVYFDAGGMPHCADPETVPVDLYQVTLTLGGEQRTVSLDGISGKVTIQ